MNQLENQSDEHISDLQNMKTQTLQMCKLAIKKDVKQLEYVKDQTQMIEIDAIDRYYYLTNDKESYCLQIIDIGLYAISRDYTALQYIRKQTYEHCEAAIRKNSSAIRFVKNKNIRNRVVDSKCKKNRKYKNIPPICRYAIDSFFKHMFDKYFVRQSRYDFDSDEDDIIKELDVYDIDRMVNCDEEINILQYMDVLSDDILLYVINNINSYCTYALLIPVIKQIKYKILELAVSKHPLLLKYVENQTYELCYSAVKENSSALQYVDDKYAEELSYIAVEYDGTYLQYVKEEFKSFELCRMAVYNDSRAFRYVYPDYRTYLNGPVLAVSCEFVQNVIEQSYDYEPIETKMVPYKPHKTNISDMPDDILKLIASYLVVFVYKLDEEIDTNGWNYDSYFWNIFYENLLKTEFKFIDGKYIESMYIHRPFAFKCREYELPQIAEEAMENMFKYDKQTYVQDIKLVADALYRLPYE